MKMQRVYVTGVGVVSSLGLGKEAFWSSAIGGGCGVSKLERFDGTSMSREYAGEVKGFQPRDFLTAAETRRTGLCSRYAVAAARMAVDDAGLSAEQMDGEQTGVVIGTTMGEVDVISELEAAWFREGVDGVTTSMIPRYGTTLLPIHVARAFGARAMVQTLPAACAAGNYAIGFAADQIRAGRIDVALTGGSEIIDMVQFAGFVRLGAMAPERCQPFDKNRRGLILGEGAGMMVLESEEHLVRRGGTPLAEVGGYGLACDAHHITRPHPEGVGSAAAVRAAIASSGLQPKDIDYVNAHGTGTAANDQIESKVMNQVFGDAGIPLSSMKGALGHCMGAASALEAVGCVMSLQTSMLPATLNYETPDPDCAVQVIHGKAKESNVEVVLNNALAFGGYDAVLCLAKPGRLPERSFEDGIVDRSPAEQTV